MSSKSAFVDKIRSSDDFYPVEAPVFHSNAYVTGGLQGLYHMIDNDIEPPISDVGQHTDCNGHFVPTGECVLGLRYKVIKILDAKGQSAVLVEAEDLFCGDKIVVIKVLHSHFYQLGKQESHVLRRLAVADPYNYSHTLRLLTTLTMDTHYCLVFEPMLPDPLNQVFSCISKSKVLTDIRRVGLRLLSSISFLHQQNIIHTDLKPENILLKQANNLDSVHIVDFGNAINFIHSEVILYYQDFELQTPLYRAPEVMFGIPFGPEIDIWSLGCILAEIYLGKHLFLGLTSEDIVKQIYELLGSFPTHLFRRGKYYKSLKKYTGEDDQSICTLKLMEYMQCSDYNFADLIAGMLRYNPEERLTASQAARHPFFASCLPLGYFIPDGKGSCSYSSVTLKKNSYQHSPYISPSIKRQPLSPLDLLKQGTVERSNLDKMLVKPHPKVAQVRGKKCSVFNEEDGIKSVSKGSNPCESSGPAFSVSYCDGNISSKQGGRSDVSVVRNLISDGKTSKYSKNVNDKITSLLQAIRDEQSVVEDDLDRRNDNVRDKNLKDCSSTKVLRPCPKYGKLDNTLMSTDIAGSSQSSDKRKSSVHEERGEDRWNDVKTDLPVQDVSGGENNLRIFSRSNCEVDHKLNGKSSKNQQRTATESSYHDSVKARNVEKRYFSKAQNSNSVQLKGINLKNEPDTTTDVFISSENDLSSYSDNEEQNCDSLQMKMSKQADNVERQCKYSSERYENFHMGIGSPHNVSPKMSEKVTGRLGSNKKFLTHPTTRLPIHSNTPNRNPLQSRRKSNQLVPSMDKDDPHQLVNERNENTHIAEVSKEQISDATPHHKSQKIYNRKPGSNISLSDEDEYLELLSPPSSVKLKRKNVQQDEVRSKNRLNSCEKYDRAREMHTRQAFLRRKSSPLEVKEKNSSFDRCPGSQNKYGDYENNCGLKLEPACVSEVELNLSEKHDLKLSARKRGSSNAEIVSALTPIRKLSPVISKNTVSPEIIYKNEKSGSRRSLSYHYGEQNNPMGVELKQDPLRFGCYSYRRDNVQCQPKEVKYENNHNVEDMDDDFTGPVGSDLNPEVSRQSEFSFRSTPSTEKKCMNSNGGIANRIAQINKKRKIIARKSLSFPNNKLDEQPVYKDDSDYHCERKRLRASNDNDSSNSDEQSSNNFMKEKYTVNDRRNYRQLVNTENKKSSTHADGVLVNCIKKGSNSDLHQFAWKSQKDVKPIEHYNKLVSQTNNRGQESQINRKGVRYQKQTVNSESARNKLKRQYIRKNDTFTIDFESPLH